MIRDHVRDGIGGPAGPDFVYISGSVAACGVRAAPSETCAGVTAHVEWWLSITTIHIASQEVEFAKMRGGGVLVLTLRYILYAKLHLRTNM